MVGATLLVALLTIGVKVASLSREVLVAAHLGTTDARDAYITASLIPGAVAMIVSNAIGGSLVPVYISARTNAGATRGKQLHAEVMLVSVGLLAVLTGLLFVGAHALLPVVARGYDADKLRLTHELYLIMLPAVMLSGLVTIWSHVLNAHDAFGFAAAAPILVPLASGVALVGWPSHGAEALAIGFVAGFALQCGLTAVALRRKGIGTPIGWYGGMAETRDVQRQLGPLVVNGIVFGGLGVVDQAMAATLGPGNVSILAYGMMLVLPIVGVTSSALGTTMFPYFSRLAAADDWDGLQSSIRGYARVILAVTVPMTIAMIVLAPFMVRLVFEHGSFTAADTHRVARVQATYALVIPIETLAVMMARVIVALRASHLMMLGSAVIFGFNIVADLVLKRWLGVEGIALATVFNQLISLIFLSLFWRLLQRRREAGA